MKTLSLSRLDKNFKYDIAAQPGASFFKRCFSCGTCTASCPVAEIDENFNPRLFIRQALLGMRKELLSSPELWYCTQCYTCYARCPQDVRFTDVMAVLRNMAIEEGYAPSGMNERSETVALASQKMRHLLAEHAWKTASGEETPETKQRITELVDETLQELEK